MLSITAEVPQAAIGVSYKANGIPCFIFPADSFSIFLQYFCFFHGGDSKSDIVHMYTVTITTLLLLL